MALTRSENMARIKATNTSPELAVRKGLSAAGLRYRLHLKTPGGKADLVMPSKRFALFIDGCFWHGCPEHYVHPRSNAPFWDKKLRANVDRDRRQTLALIEQGWTFVRVWEHEVRENPLRVVARIQRHLERRGRPLGGWRVVRVAEKEDGSLEERGHEDLLNPGKKMKTLRERTTAKQGRVAKGQVQSPLSPLKPAKQ